LDGLLAGFLQSLRFLVSKLPVVHDATHGWTCLSGDLDEIEICSPCPIQGLCDADDANLGTVCVNQTNFACADSIVEPWFLNWRCYGRTLLCKWRRLLFVATCRPSRARATSLGARLSRALRKDPDALTLRADRQASGWESLWLGGRTSPPLRPIA
jgi:hypothetical protein